MKSAKTRRFLGVTGLVPGAVKGRQLSYLLRWFRLLMRPHLSQQTERDWLGCAGPGYT